MMKRYGDIGNVRFRRVGWSIKALSYHYYLIKDGQNKSVYVNNMRELKNEIALFDEERNYHGRTEKQTR